MLVGAGTGLGAVFFIYLISLIQTGFFEKAAAPFGFLGHGLFILAPAVGGLLAGPIIAYYAKEAKGHGVPEVMQAMALRGGRIRPRVVLAKVAASALCIGSGGSAGREGPIVQVGAALGSTLGQWFDLSEARIQNLVACGAAAGIAATFNAPIAGTLFAMEIILGELRLMDMGTVVVSAVSGSTVARAFLGQRPAFSIPRYTVLNAWETLLCALLGLLAALAAIGFIRLLYWCEEQFDHWRFPEVLKPGMGGLLLGLVAYAYPYVLGLGFVPGIDTRLGLPISASIPHVFGSGFPVIENTLLGNFSLGLLLALIVLKPLATSLTLGSGNSGGVFAPALFTGAVLGSAFGKMIGLLLPGVTAQPGAFATVGMAAVFAGAAHAPFTAILIVLEMTDDYGLILQLMTGVVASYLVSEYLHPESIYTLKLTLRGIRLVRGRDVDAMDSVRVEEVMVREPHTVPADLPIKCLASEFLETSQHGFPVIDVDGRLLGMVCVEDYRRALLNGGPPTTELLVRDIASRELVTAYPDETVGTVMRRMAPRDLSRLPVVERTNPHRLVGLVRRNDIVRAHDIALTRRAIAELSPTEGRLWARAATSVEEIPVELDSAAAGKRVDEVPWPQTSALALIQRQGEMTVPQGDSTIATGDVLIVVGDRTGCDQIRRLCASGTIRRNGEELPGNRDR